MERTFFSCESKNFFKVNIIIRIIIECLIMTLHVFVLLNSPNIEDKKIILILQNHVCVLSLILHCMLQSEEKLETNYWLVFGGMVQTRKGKLHEIRLHDSIYH